MTVRPSAAGPHHRRSMVNLSANCSNCSARPVSPLRSRPSGSSSASIRRCAALSRLCASRARRVSEEFKRPNLSSVICAPVDNLPPRPDGLNPGRFPPERTSQVCEQPYLKSIYVWIVNRYHTWRGRSPAPPWLGPRRGRKNKLSGKLTTLFQAVGWAFNLT